MSVARTDSTPLSWRPVLLVPTIIDAQLPSSPDGLPSTPLPEMPRPATPPAPLRPAMRGIRVGEGRMPTSPECLVQRDGYSVRIANSIEQRLRASALIQRMYASRGYQTEVASALAHNANRITLEASSPRELRGTLTLGLDSEQGLLADALYRPEISEIRKRRRRVCELSRFAVDPDHGSRELLASLFQAAYVYARHTWNIDDAVIEVNPRHTGFYKRMLGFRELGGTRICPRVNAPAVLLHIDLDYMAGEIRRHSGKTDTGERSLYPHFDFECVERTRSKRVAHAA